MEILLIPDKFKDSLDAISVIDAIKDGIHKYNPKLLTHNIVASDGGDGFLNAIHFNNNSLQIINIESVDALKRTITSKYLFDPINSVAYIELANTCGLEMLSIEERNPTMTTTFGCGMQIKHAIKNGASQIYIGLGGSATNDGGIGIAHALGFRFLDINQSEVEPIGKNLALIDKIVDTDVSLLKGVKLYAVNDVDNKLFGNSGATMVYGKQKGASPLELKLLEEGIQVLDRVVQKDLNLSLANIKGTGAAGGTGYGLKTFLNAKFISGVDFILNMNNVISLLEKGNIDLIITGEGSIDDQTINGKLIKGVADIANSYNIPVVAVCGKLNITSKNRDKLKIKDIIEIADYTKPLDYNLKNAYNLISKSVYNYFSNLNTIK